MAKTSSVQKNGNREKLVCKARSKRAQLKAIIMDRGKPFEERFAATTKLAAMPRNGAASRLRKRCLVTGRARGNYAKFKLSRIVFRNMASEGLIPGVTKSSW